MNALGDLEKILVQEIFGKKQIALAPSYTNSENLPIL
jgi:hypothetical protein